MKILSVEIRDILSIANMKIEFGENGLVLVDGVNGAGKSAIFNSLAFGIYDKTPRKITKSEMLRRGTKDGHVIVQIEKDGAIWGVKRCRPNYVTFYKDDVEKIMSQEEFEGHIGLSYSQFLITMYAAQLEGQKLITLNDAGTKDFFLQLMNLEKFAVHKKKVDEECKEKRELIVKLEKMIAEAASRISAYEEYSIDVDDIRAKIKSNESSASIIQLQKLMEIEKPDLSKYHQLFQKINDKLMLDVNGVIQQIEQARHEITRLSLRVDHEYLICPKCDTNFIEYTDKEDQYGHSISTAISTKENYVKLGNEKISYLKAFIQDHSYVEKEEQELEELREKVSKKKTAEETEYNSSRIKIADLKRVIAVQESRSKSLNDQLIQHEETQSKIEKYSSLKEKSELKLQETNKELELLETLSSILSPTGAPAYIMDSVVDVFNDKMSEYVTMIWPSASYRIQTFKENKKGEVKAKFSEELIIDGRSVSIGSLSGGEFKCLSLSMDFAAIDVLESMFSMYVNPIILDEPFEWLDASNREVVVDLLEKLSSRRQIMVIDHASEAKAMFSDVIKIVKENGVSRMI